MSEIASAFVSIIPSFKGGTKALSDELTGGELGKVGEKAGATMGDSTKKGFKAHMSGGFAKLAGAAFGVAVLDFGKQSVEAYADAAASQRKLTDAYARFPAIHDKTIKSFQDEAAALQNKTKFDGDDINAMQGSLAQYKLTGAQISQLTPLVLDYAQKTGKSLPDAAAVMGKAVLGSGKALKGIGLNFVDTKTKAGNFKELVSGLRTQVGGFATKEGKTASGQAAIMSHRFGDLQENIGSKLLPALTSGLVILSKFTKFLSENATATKIVVGAIALLAVAYGSVVVYEKAAAVATKIWTAATKAAEAAQWLFNAAMAANPVALVVIGIVALGAAIFIAYKKSATFRKIVQAAFKGVLAAGKAMASFFTKTLPHAFDAVLKGIKSAFKKVFSFLKTVGPIALAALFPFIGIPVLIGMHFGGIKKLLAAVWSAVLSGIAAFMSKVKAAFAYIPTLVKNVGAWFGKLPGLFVKVMVGAHIAVLNGLKAVGASLKTRILAAVNYVGTYLKGLPGKFTAVFSLAHTAVSNAISSIQATLATRIRSTVTYVGSYLAGLPGKFSAVFSLAHRAVSNAISAIQTTLASRIRSTVGYVGGYLAGLPGKFTSVFSTVYGNVKSFLSNIGSYFAQIPGKISSIAGSMYNAGKSVIGHVFSGISAAIGGAGGFAGNVAKQIGNALIGGLNRVLPHSFHIGLNKGPFHLNETIPLVPNIPYLAEGGIVPAQKGGRIVKVAEAGQAEAVIPLSKLAGMTGGAGKGGDSHWNIYSQTDPIATARAVERRLAFAGKV